MHSLRIRRKGIERVVTLDRDRFLLGRGPGNDLWFQDDEELSRYHLLIERCESGWLAADLSGGRATMLNGKPLSRASKLQAGDRLQAGSVELVLESDESALAEQKPQEPIERIALKDLWARPDESTRSMLAVFRNAAEALDSRESVGRLESRILEFAIELTGAECGSLSRLEGGALQRRLTLGRPGTLALALAEMACSAKSTLRLGAAELEGYATGLSAALVVPLEEDEEASGVLYVCRTKGEFTREEAEALTLYGTLAAQVLERARLQGRLERLAYFDPVTGLANRAKLQELLDERIRMGLPASLAVLRMSRLNLFRNTVGRTFVDRLVTRLAEQVRQVLLEGELVCRSDYNSLAVMIPGKDQAGALEGRLEAISEQLTRPVWVSSKQVYPAVSIGVATLASRHHSGEEVIRDAEIAAERAKRLGPPTKFLVFDETMHRRLLRIHEVESGLRRALATGEQLTVAYQPLIRMASGELAGFEVLVRWNHPEYGVIQPSEFIPLAEETGLISAVGRKVLGLACERLAEWRRMNGGRDLTLAVNVSARQLADEQFESDLQEAILQSGIRASDLCLELTESAMIDDLTQTVRTMQSLRRLGVKLALDDLGTGYSSFQYLYKLPLDTIKIDRSFIVAMRTVEETRQVVRLIADLGRILNLEIVAEGIEMVEDLEAMRQIGCDLGQGFLFGQPVSEYEAGEIVSGRQPWRESGSWEWNVTVTPRGLATKVSQMPRS